MTLENCECNKVLLIDVKEGQKGVILSILAGRGASKRLADLGLTPGTEIRVLEKALWGPVEIEARGSKLAIGRGLASKILVKLE